MCNSRMLPPPQVESAMKGMKDDPELKPMMDQLEKDGPMAMMK